MRYTPATEARRLLRLLLVCDRAVSADPSRNRVHVGAPGEPATKTTNERTRDVMSSRLRMVLLYLLPGAAIYSTGSLGDREVTALVWPVAFMVMGVACVANARSCGRVHCFFTGPLFLLASLLSALHGGRVVDFGPSDWELIGYGTFSLAFVLYFVPEAIWGKYFRS